MDPSLTDIVEAFLTEYGQMMALAQDLNGDFLPENDWCKAVLRAWVSRKTPW